MTCFSDQIIISGGGVTAELMALALSRHHIDCVLVGVAPEKVDDQPAGHSARTIAVWRKGLEILQDLGIDAASLADSHPIRGLSLVDETARETHFTPQQAGLTGYFGLNLRLDALHNALRQQNSGLRRIDARTRRWLAPGKLQLSNQEVISGALVIVAEGKDSITAQQAGITPVRFHSGLVAMIMPVTHATPHQQTSFEFHRRPGPLAFVPQQEYHSAIVWLHEHDQIPNLNDTARLIARLNADSGGKMQVQKILEPPQVIPLSSRQALTLRAERLCLIGESAHRLPPTGAQGLNLTLRDIACLAGLLQQARADGRDAGSRRLLADYSGARLKDGLAVSLAVHLANNSIRHAERIGGLPGLIRRTIQHRLVPQFSSLSARAMRRALYGF